MFIVRHGEVVWSYTHDGRGEISDAVLLPTGNVLFAHQYGITEITSDKKVVWNYDAPPKTEIHTAQPFGSNSVCFVQNGDPAKFVVMSKASGKHPRAVAIFHTFGCLEFRHAIRSMAGEDGSICQSAD